MATDTLDLSKLAKYFSDEDAARALLEDMRWGKDGAVCPHCGGTMTLIERLTPQQIRWRSIAAGSFSDTS